MLLGLTERKRSTARSGHCHGLALAVCVCLLSAAARGDGASIAVVPLGRGGGFEPTARVAIGIANQLNTANRSAHLRYILPSERTDPAQLERARALLDKALQAYQTLHFDEVRARARRALARFEKVIEADGPVDGYVATLHLLAATNLVDGHKDDAVRAMRDAVVFSQSPPRTDRYNPRIQRLHTRLLTEGEQSTLRLKSAPRALIWLDGKIAGLAEGSIRLRAGRHWIRIFRPGYAPWLEWVRIEPGDANELSPTLSPLPANEAALLTDVRRSTTAEAPNAAVAQASKQLGSKDLIFVGAVEPDCPPTRCAITMHWASDGRWVGVAQSVYSGHPDTVANSLLVKASVPAAGDRPADGFVAGGPPQGDQARSCVSDGDCGAHQRCADGRCARIVPLTRKWWFWTLVGVAAGGVAASIAVPLATAQGAPVIEIR